MLEFLSQLPFTLLGQDGVDPVQALQSKARWWDKLGNVLFGAVIVLLVISLLLTFWRRSVNKRTEAEARKKKVEEILAEDISQESAAKLDAKLAANQEPAPENPSEIAKDQDRG